MATVSLGSHFQWPAVPAVGTNGDSSITFNEATADYVALVMKAPATGTIDKVYMRIGSTTLAATLSCQVQTLDSAGDPSGTAYGSSAQVDLAVTGTEDNTTLTFSGLACSATAGDHIAIKIWCSSFTSGSGSLTYQANTVNVASRSLPYLTIRSTGAGAGTHTAAGGGITVEYSGAVYYDIDFAPACNASSESVDSDGSLRRIGNRIIVPAPMTVCGIWTILDWDTDSTTLKLYDTDSSTVLGTCTLVTANRTNTSAGMVKAFFDSGSTVALTANTANPYRVVVETNNTSATAATVRTLQNITAAHMAQLSGGNSVYYTSHNGSAWTDTTTKRTTIGLLVSGIDDGTGGGGGLAIPVSGRIVA